MLKGILLISLLVSIKPYEPVDALTFTYWSLLRFQTISNPSQNKFDKHTHLPTMIDRSLLAIGAGFFNVRCWWSPVLSKLVYNGDMSRLFSSWKMVFLCVFVVSLFLEETYQFPNSQPASNNQQISSIINPLENPQTRIVVGFHGAPQHINKG